MSLRSRQRARSAFDPARHRLRELERIIDARAGCARPDQFLPAVARALLLVRRNKPGSLTADELFDRLETWARRHAPDAQRSQLRKAAEGAIARPYLDKADRLARHLVLTYAERQRLCVRTIGACDVDKAGRAQLAKMRKRERDRARRARMRRAAGAAPREKYLAGSLSQTQPWLKEGVSKRTWYRRRAAVLGTGASPAGTGPSPSPQRVTGTGASPHIFSTAEQPTCANGSDVTRPAPARRAGNRRASPHQSEPPALVGEESSEHRGQSASLRTERLEAIGQLNLFCEPSRIRSVGQLNGAARAGLASSGASGQPSKLSSGARDERGRQMLQLQKFGVAPSDARAEIDRWYTAVAPQTIKDAFAGALRRTRGPADGRQWLKSQMERAMRDPHYLVPNRAARRGEGSSAAPFIDAFRKSGAPSVTVAGFVALIDPPLSRNAVKTRLAIMTEEGLLERVGRGRYRLAVPAEKALAT